MQPIRVNVREHTIMDSDSKTRVQSPNSVEAAFMTVMQTFESRLAGSEGTDVHTVISQAIDSIRAARKAIDRMESTPPPPPGAPKPGSKEELEEELTKEKMDP